MDDTGESKWDLIVAASNIGNTRAGTMDGLHG